MKPTKKEYPLSSQEKETKANAARHMISSRAFFCIYGNAKNKIHKSQGRYGTDFNMLITM